MCNIIQYPVNFASCGHLYVVASFTPCVVSHVPGRQGLYCSPFEWDLQTADGKGSCEAQCPHCSTGRMPIAAPRRNEPSRRRRSGRKSYCSGSDETDIDESEATTPTPRHRREATSTSPRVKVDPSKKETVEETDEEERIAKKAAELDMTVERYKAAVAANKSFENPVETEATRQKKKNTVAPFPATPKAPSKSVASEKESASKNDDGTQGSTGWKPAKVKPVEVVPQPDEEEVVHTTSLDNRPLPGQGEPDDEALTKAAANYGMSVEEYKEIVAEQKAMGKK